MFNLRLVSIGFLLSLFFVGCSVSKQPDSSVKVNSISESKISESNTSWEKAYNRGVELHKAGKFEEATYYFSNALGSAAGNYKVIEAYHEAMLQLNQTTGQDNLSALQVTLQNQIPLLPFEDVEKVLSLLATVKTKIELSKQEISKLAVQKKMSWAKAYNHGVELYKAGKFEEAAYYFSNALGSAVGNYKVIEAYYKTMTQLGQTTDQDNLSMLQIIEAFLQSQIPLVPFENIENILSLLSDVKTKIVKLQQETTLSSSSVDVQNAWKSFQDNPYNVPDSEEELLMSLELLGTFREYVARFNITKSVDKLDKAITQTQAVLDYKSFSTLLDNQERAVEDSTKSSSVIAEYQLQECEQYLREMMSLRVNLPEKYTTELTKRFDKLKKLAELIAEAKSMELWNITVLKLDKYKKSRDEIIVPTFLSGVNQQKLENIQLELQELQNVFQFLVGKSLDAAITRRDNINKEAFQLTNERSKAYNFWAMQQIQDCLEQGRGGLGWIANGQEGRETIGQALIEKLGPIDRRYLTAEVSRCYDEVLGKYLAPNQLNPVKDEKSINEKGNILHTLKEMNAKEKMPIERY